MMETCCYVTRDSTKIRFLFHLSFFKWIKEKHFFVTTFSTAVKRAQQNQSWVTSGRGGRVFFLVNEPQLWLKLTILFLPNQVFVALCVFFVSFQNRLWRDGVKTRLDILNSRHWFVDFKVILEFYSFVFLTIILNRL